MNNLFISLATRDGIIKFTDFNDVLSFLNDAQNLTPCFYVMGDAHTLFNPLCLFSTRCGQGCKGFNDWLSLAASMASAFPEKQIYVLPDTDALMEFCDEAIAEGYNSIIQCPYSISETGWAY